MTSRVPLRVRRKYSRDSEFDRDAKLVEDINRVLGGTVEAPVSIDKGGTAATSEAAARANLGLGIVKQIEANTASPISYVNADFEIGWNIIRVLTAGAVTINLPSDLGVDKIVAVKDERGTASSANITVTVV